MMVVAEIGGMAVQIEPTVLAGSRFQTAGMDEQAARAAYRARLDGILTTEFLAPFKADMTAYRLGPLGVLALSASARRSIRTADRVAQDGYGSLGVQCVLAGRATGDADGRPVVSEPGTILLLDYARPFTIIDHEPRDVLDIAVPRALLSKAQIGHGDWHGTTPSSPAADLLAGFMRALSATLPTLPAPAGPPLATAIVALLTSVLIDAASPAGATPAEQLVRRADTLVETWIGSANLTPAWLAAKLGVSRSELYVALERFGGVSRFILQRRLDGARAALEDPHDPRQIKGIAFAFGFASEAQFSRAFRATFDTTASDIRRAVRTRLPAMTGRHPSTATA